MSDDREGRSGAYERIRSKKTLQEILEVATSFEKAARDFYADLVPKVSKNLRYLVEELAQEEQQHFDLFSKLANNPGIDAQIHDMIQTPVEDRRFSCIREAYDATIQCHIWKFFRLNYVQKYNKHFTILIKLKCFKIRTVNYFYVSIKISTFAPHF